MHPALTCLVVYASVLCARVELVTPAGTRALVHNAVIAQLDEQLLVSKSSRFNAALALLRGTPLAGDWRLEIRVSSSFADTCALNRWQVRLAP